MNSKLRRSFIDIDDNTEIKPDVEVNKYLIKDNMRRNSDLFLQRQLSRRNVMYQRSIAWKFERLIYC